MNIQNLVLLSSLYLLASCSHSRKEPEEERPSSVICPQTTKKVFLPRTFPVSEIFVGFSSDTHHLDFIDTLVKASANKKSNLKLNIVIPSAEKIEAYNYFRNNHKTQPHLRFISTQAQETIWIQDYFELLTNTQTGKHEILDLPYWDRDEETTPYDIALNLQRSLIEQVKFAPKAEAPGNGDYGGNIESLSTKILAIGDNMTSELRSHIQNLTDQELLSLDVSWLETGHVDEVINLLPHNDQGNSCDQTLMVVSPGLAINFLQSHHYEERVSKEDLYFESYNDGEEQWPNYTPCLKKANKNKPDCKNFFKSNQIYQGIITKNVIKIQKAFQKHHGCKLKVLNIPTLFATKEPRQQYGTSNDRAVAFNQNSVNNIFFSETLILPKQSISLFQAYLEKELSFYKLNIIFANGDHVHNLSGGIHCATNVAYSCVPPKSN